MKNIYTIIVVLRTAKSASRAEFTRKCSLCEPLIGRGGVRGARVRAGCFGGVFFGMDEMGWIGGMERWAKGYSLKEF